MIALTYNDEVPAAPWADILIAPGGFWEELGEILAECQTAAW